MVEICKMLTMCSGLTLKSLVSAHFLLDFHYPSKLFTMMCHSSETQYWLSSLLKIRAATATHKVTAMVTVVPFFDSRCSCRRLSWASLISAHASTMCFIISEWPRKHLSNDVICHLCKLPGEWKYLTNEYTECGKIKQPLEFSAVFSGLAWNFKTKFYTLM